MPTHGRECIECTTNFKIHHQILSTWVEVFFMSTLAGGFWKNPKNLSMRLRKFGWRTLRRTSWSCFSTGLNNPRLFKQFSLNFEIFRFYPIFATICVAIYPTVIPVILFNEAPHIAFGVAMFRWLLTWSQYAISNSFAHLYGYRPHDKNFSARNLWLWQIM